MIRPIPFNPEAPTTGNRWVIGNLEGNAEALKTLLFDKLAIQPQDQLLFLGGYFGVGKDNLAVAETLQMLMAAGYHIQLLRSPEEAALLSLAEEGGEDLVWYVLQQNLPDLLEGENLHPLVLHFLRQTQLHLETDRAMLAFSKGEERWLEAVNHYAGWMLAGDCIPPAYNAAQKIHIFAEEYWQLAAMQEAVNAEANHISLNNLPFEPTPTTEGCLCALQLDNMLLVVQPVEQNLSPVAVLPNSQLLN